ncbi:MAG: DUF1697 domain-containing protein [Acidobacteria bacterium]|nr:DUF1697 domain-containing protein [Acidobacteriota bacterium]MCL5286429.1 DUF1697 domain-containing protein [Acidobacteriota bacterium]
MKPNRLKKQIAYAAFLRGINVGGHKLVKMDDLKKAVESLGFTNVKTLLASGNVVFQAPPASASVLAKRIEEKLKKSFGFEIGILIRPIKELQRLDKANPFAGIKVTPRIRLFVTFLSEKPAGSLKIPYVAPGGNFKILRASKSEVCSVLTITNLRRGMQFMAILDKEFGPKITTRSWGTIVRILDAGK